MITIEVPWTDNDGLWNELLSWTLENFGLNGGKWRFEPCKEYMRFHFENEDDALLFQLKTAGYRKTPQEQAVELVGMYVNR